MRKLLKLLLILSCIFIFYAPVELTRVILDWEGFSGKFIFEVCFIWFPYVIAMGILSVVLASQTKRKEVPNGQ